jgi:DNA-binding protein HU-beta
MNRETLIKHVRENSSLNAAQSETLVKGLLGRIANALENGEEVILHGLGRFKTVTRAARQGTNPATKEKISIPAKKIVKFTPTGELRDQVNAA